MQSWNIIKSFFWLMNEITACCNIVFNMQSLRPHKATSSLAGREQKHSAKLRTLLSIDKKLSNNMNKDHLLVIAILSNQSGKS